MLSKTEEIVLLAVYRLDCNACGVTIRSEIESNTSINMSVSNKF